MAKRLKSNRIDGMRDDETGVIGPAHYIGQSSGDRPEYAWVEGYTPMYRHVDPDTGKTSYVPTTRLIITDDGTLCHTRD